MAYIDTSVLVACYCPEALSEKAERAVRRARPPAISPLVEVEFASALSLKVRTGGMDAETAGRVLAAFRLHIDEQRFQVVPVEAKAYALASEWLGSFTAPLRTVDALHLATAHAAGLPLVTADKALADSAKRFGVKHRFIS
ncbi:MAG: type II toxin-antitoxin system VapC family toxin [Phycisphaerae bacterium]